MIVNSKEDRQLVFPEFFLSGVALQVCREITYLGQLYARANVLARKCIMCSVNLKVALYRAFCTPLYIAPLWHSYKKSNMQDLMWPITMA